MLLGDLSEINWNFYNDGRPKATNRTFDKADVRQYLRLAISDIFRFRYYENKKLNEGNDFYFIAPLLAIQNFVLGTPNEVGLRIADMSQFDLFRLPHDMHITNIYPVGCGGAESASISLVEPGEEYFYTKPAYKFFKFGVVKGRNINTYHLPPCAKSIDVEAAYDGEGIDPDIPMDVAFEASNQVLGKMLGMPDFPTKGADNPYTLPQKRLQQRLNAKQDQPQEQ